MITRCRNPFSQWQHSFQMKAALLLTKCLRQLKLKAVLPLAKCLRQLKMKAALPLAKCLWRLKMKVTLPLDKCSGQLKMKAVLPLAKCLRQLKMEAALPLAKCLWQLKMKVTLPLAKCFRLLKMKDLLPLVKCLRQRLPLLVTLVRQGASGQTPMFNTVKMIYVSTSYLEICAGPQFQCSAKTLEKWGQMTHAVEKYGDIGNFPGSLMLYCHSWISNLWGHGPLQQK